LPGLLAGFGQPPLRGFSRKSWLQWRQLSRIVTGLSL